jgi:hypothetical protein
MLTFSDETLRSQVRDGELKSIADHIAFLPFTDLKQSVLDDIALLRGSQSSAIGSAHHWLHLRGRHRQDCQGIDNS